MSNCKCVQCQAEFEQQPLCHSCIRNEGMLSKVHGKCKQCGAWKKFVAKGMCAGCYQAERRSKLSLVKAPDAQG